MPYNGALSLMFSTLKKTSGPGAMTPDLSSTALPWYQRIRPSRVVESADLECIEAAFEHQAARTPKRAILVDDCGHLTYEELCGAVESRAANLLQHCRSRSGGTAVGVLLDNDTQKIVTYFACLKAGLAYIPLESYPAAIMEQIFSRAPFGALVTSRQFAPVLPASQKEGLTTLWCEDTRLREGVQGTFPRPDPLRLAHIAFTSGTRAGIPKMVETDQVGSVLSHGWRGRLWPSDPQNDVVGCNIFGIWDVVPALCRGIPAVLIADGVMRDPFALASAIIRFGITRIMITPTLLGACLDCSEGIQALRHLRLLVLCGEIVTPGLMHRAWEVLPRVRIVNLYSTAECHDIAAGELRRGKEITSGMVADFAEVHLCDPNNPHRLVKVGSAGRILVGGSALALACGHGPGCRADGFLEVELPAASGGCRPTRVYDTGDLGMFHPGGELEILGRCDSGIKIRGSWVEPAAVEGIVEQHPLVRRACVTAEIDNRGQTELVAFVTTRQGDMQAADLAGQLHSLAASSLPPPSVPGRFIPVAEFPLLPSGKVDRRQLPAVQQISAGPASIRMRPCGLQRRVLSSFREALDDATVGLEDDFEARGGHSLRAIRLCGILHHRTGRRIQVGDIYLQPTPMSMFRHLQQRQDQQPRPEWRPPELDFATAGAIRPRFRTRPRTVLVTGATGFLGSALVHTLLRETSAHIVALVRAGGSDHPRRRLNKALENFESSNLPHPDVSPRLQVILGDLAKPLMGLTSEAFTALGGEVEAIFHLAADLDLFASYGDVESINVGGTREVLRLAFERGTPVHCVSSSAVFPLGRRTWWAQETFGLDSMKPLAGDLATSGADGYSLSKCAAELLVWSAFERGLPASVVRVPHILGHSQRGLGQARDRLMMTVRAFATAGLFPEGDWGWQFAPVDLVCRELVSGLKKVPSRDRPVRHIALEPLRAAEVLAALRALGFEPHLLSLPALAKVMIAVARSGAGSSAMAADPGHQAVCATAQLILQYGPRAALNLSDARLVTAPPFPGDPAAIFGATFGQTCRRSSVS